MSANSLPEAPAISDWYVPSRPAPATLNWLYASLVMMCVCEPVSSVAVKYLGGPPLGSVVPPGDDAMCAVHVVSLGSCWFVNPKTTCGTNPLIGGELTGNAV